MRNPVAAIRAQAEASLGAAGEAAARDGLAKIAASATRLSRLVNQLLAPGGTVELEAPTVASGAKVELQVVDAGPGVPDALRVLVEFGSAMAGEESAE